MTINALLHLALALHINAGQPGDPIFLCDNPDPYECTDTVIRQIEDEFARLWERSGRVGGLWIDMSTDIGHISDLYADNFDFLYTDDNWDFELINIQIGRYDVDVDFRGSVTVGNQVYFQGDNVACNGLEYRSCENISLSLDFAGDLENMVRGTPINDLAEVVFAGEDTCLSTPMRFRIMENSKCYGNGVWMRHPYPGCETTITFHEYNTQVVHGPSRYSCIEDTLPPSANAFIRKSVEQRVRRIFQKAVRRVFGLRELKFERIVPPERQPPRLPPPYDDGGFVPV